MRKSGEIIGSFKYGSFVYSYYAYLNKFHTEPRDWRSLMEYMEFNKTENNLSACYAEQAENNR
jgi:hypothetical protein